MTREVTYKETLSVIESLYKLTEQKYGETNDSRFLALYDLSRKMRSCMNAVILLSHDEYEVLCVPINLLYRCMITDLMTALLISIIDDNTFDKVMHVMDIDYIKSLQKALNTDIEARKTVYPKDAEDIEKMALDYQVQHFDDLKDCLKSQKGEKWKVQTKEKLEINDIVFNGTIDSIFNVLSTYKHIRDIASVYQYYRLFSQTEHFSLKSRVFNYKQEFHERYYNKTRGFIRLGIEYILKKFSAKT